MVRILGLSCLQNHLMDWRTGSQKGHHCTTASKSTSSLIGLRSQDATSAPLLTLLRMPFVLLKLGSSYQKIESEESTVSKQPHFILFLVNRNHSRKEICISHHPQQRSFGHVVFSFFFSFSFVLKVLS